MTGCSTASAVMPAASRPPASQASRWAIRSDAVRGSVPILMVTTRGAREDIVSAVEAGVSNYILKPFTPSVLKEKIDRLLAGMGAAA